MFQRSTQCAAPGRTLQPSRDSGHFSYPEEKVPVAVADSTPGTASLFVAYRDYPIWQIARVILFGVWFAVVLYLAWHHSFFRDEVRALTLALSGSGILGMIATVHGEGHPLIWYLLLRTGYALVGSTLVLPVTAGVIAFAAAALLVFRSPFGPLPIALMLFGRMLLYEYSVMARNYGISMLLMFVIACVYERWRNRGYLLGVLLLLLANTNVHSVILVCAFLVFWFLDVLFDQTVPRVPALKRVALNGVIAGLGIIICFLTVHPCFNDAAFSGIHFDPDTLFHVLTLDGISLCGAHIFLQVALFGTVLGLIRHPAAAVSLLAAMLGLSLLFAVIYPSEYHHSALVISYAIMLYWICLQRELAARRDLTGASIAGIFRNSRHVVLQTEKGIASVGRAAFVLVLVSQIIVALPPTEGNIRDGVPESQVPAFARFIQNRPDLKDAVIVADPDFLIEPLPYFIDNPTYLIRENRFRNFVTYTRRSRLEISLDDVLFDARKIAASRRVPIVILVTLPLNSVTAPVRHKEGLDWKLDVDPAQVLAFSKQTKLLGHFRPAQTDEEFDAYLLTPGDRKS
jgi:hypothetical protein